MECIAAFCFYLGASLGTPVDSVQMASVKYHTTRRSVGMAGDLVGHVVAGVEHRSGFYIELDHQSGVLNPNDHGVNLARVGYRFKFNLGE